MVFKHHNTILHAIIHTSHDLFSKENRRQQHANMVMTKMFTNQDNGVGQLFTYNWNNINKNYKKSVHKNF